jgi:2-methylcitrate dehydratase PrpD
MMPASATAAIIGFATAQHAIPAAVRADAVRLLADTLACGVAGATAPGADGVYAAAAAMAGAADGDGVPILGRALRLPAPGAAMVNGFQIHCLEWDAVHEPAVVHAMSVVVAAIHAAAHRAGGVQEDEALQALCVGVEIACLLGVAATSPLRFFRPATAGLIGAALATARIHGLPAGCFADVLGMAYSQCAGTMQAHAEGSVALPVQIGLAARAAITAVDLVQFGLDAPHDALEGAFGYFALFDTGTLAPHIGSLGRHWRIAELSVKPWPSGRASHGTLAMLAALRDCSTVARIVAHVPPLVARLVGRPWHDTMTPAYARLCLPFLLALMITDGRIDPRRFNAASFADPALRALGARLEIRSDGNPDPNALAPQRFDIAFSDGQKRSIAMPHTLGAPGNPLDGRGHAAKLAFALAMAATPADPAIIAAPLSYLAGQS